LWFICLAHGNAIEIKSFRKFTRQANAAALCHAPAWLSGRFHVGLPFEFLEMKRFTETLKWNDPWFRKLSPELKLLWGWLVDNCDHAGVIEPDMELASFQIGFAMGIDNLSELGERLWNFDGKKWLVVKFIEFQYGELSSDCRGHNPVFVSLTKHRLEVVAGENGRFNKVQQIKGIQKTPIGAKTGQDRTGQGQDKVGGCKGEGIYSPESRVALHYLNEKSGRHYRESESSLSVIQARLSGPEVDIEGVKMMIDRQCAMWIGDKMAEYLRPETLFGKQKFEGYYAGRDQPVIQYNANGKKIVKPKDDETF
jgi:uncharacterized phage protein (TIGR02220 family)